MTEKPIIEYQIEPETADRLASIKEVEDGAVIRQVPVLLEDTGNADDLEKARSIVANGLLVKIIKGTASADEILRYNALKN